jgi:hypothetical protein
MSHIVRSDDFFFLPTAENLGHRHKTRFKSLCFDMVTILRLRPHLASPVWSVTRKSLSDNTISYYDSQSGIHVSYSYDLKVHGLLPEEAAVNTSWQLPIHGVDAVTLPVGKSDLDIAALEGFAIGSVFTQVTETMPGRVGAASIDLQVSAPRKEWDSAVSMCSAARSQGAKVKVNLLGSHEVDPGKVALAACLVADVGAEIITVEAAAESEDAEEDLSEMWEELVGCDIAGLPMQHRVGLRLRTEVGNEELEESMLVKAVVELGIRNIDVWLAPHTAPSPAPAVSYEALRRALKGTEVGSPLELKC